MPRFAATLLPFATGLLSLLFLISCNERKKETTTNSKTKTSSEEAAIDPAELIEWLSEPAIENPSAGFEFVGAKSCKSCHEKAYEDWTKSHHYAAMQHANAESVLGDFDDAEFEHYGHKSKFFKKGEEFWVNTEDSEGTYRDFKIEYAFGIYPLQQYLIAFPGGRYQALQVCWDSRKAEDGGQRWYHLYNEEIAPNDVLHWTRRHFNWNYMCADCHSTNLVKNFDVEKNAYETTWSEMNVSCEACHGPGSGHLDWAELEKAGEGKGEEKYSENLGLLVKLSESQPANWGIDPETQQPKRSHPVEHQNQLETCAPCHAHRQPLQNTRNFGQHFLDSYLPTNLTRVHYHADGQIKEEVYVYGSFTQSKMYHSDVRCTDCHHPHTMQTYAPDNNLCNRCHIPTKYDTPAHHMHEIGSTGAACVDCHMPTKVYMGVDARRDHSIRIPRPDLSKTFKTPNACTNCHEGINPEHDNKWAAEEFTKLWGSKVRKSYGESLAKGRRDPEFWQKELVRLAEDVQKPGIARASALDLIAEAPGTKGPEALAERLTDPDPIVRHHAIGGLEDSNLQPYRLAELVARSLRDPIRAVRIEAGRVLAGIPRRTFKVDDLKFLDAAVEEYIAAQMAVSDVPEGHLSLSLLYQRMGDSKKEEEHLLNAIRIDPMHPPGRVNLAEVYFRLGRLDEGGPVLEEGVKLQPNDGHLHEALGLFYVRKKAYEKGMEHWRKAAEILPERHDLQYRLGVGLNSLGNFPDALLHLQRAHSLAPESIDYLFALATVCRDKGEYGLAIGYAERLTRLNPNQPQFSQLLQQLRYLQEQQAK